MQYKNFSVIHKFQSTNGKDIFVLNNHLAAKKYLYLIAGVHGDEHEGVYVLEKLLQWLDESSLTLPPIIVIPVVNPDGLANKQRKNINGVDLNRNLNTASWNNQYTEDQYYPGQFPLSEVENKGLVDIFNTYAPGFVFSFHSWKPMINYNGNCKKVAEFLSSFNNYEVVDNVGYSTPGSLGELGPEKYDCPVITYECPRVNVDVVWSEAFSCLKEFFLQWQKLLPEKIL